MTTFLNINKLTGTNIVTVAAQHNLRTLGIGHGPHIDLRLSDGNIILRGPDAAAAVGELARALMAKAGIKKLRKDAVRALEAVFSLPPGSAIDPHEFFERAIQWIEKYLGVPVLSAVVHVDEGPEDAEGAPHAHVLLLPLINGHMTGSNLMGSQGRLRSLQADFYEQVARHYGFPRKASACRLGAAQRRDAADAFINELRAHPERLNDSKVVAALRQAIAVSPELSLRSVGIDIPPPQPLKRKLASSFVAQMTKPVRPDSYKPNRVFDESRPIGFASDTQPGKDEPYHCVGFDAQVVPAEADGTMYDVVGGHNHGMVLDLVAGCGSLVTQPDRLIHIELSAIDVGQAADVGELLERTVVREDSMLASTWDAGLGEHVVLPRPVLAPELLDVDRSQTTGDTGQRISIEPPAQDPYDDD